jgi:diadenosine tetraphosphate (Ap4A) HIT family hydrolase
MDCLLCHPLPGYEVWERAHWRLAVNYNQNTLGKCFLILKRHDEDICDLTSDELTDLWAAIRRVRDALRTRFQPDRFNYSFLMNQDRHVHLHVIPRYDAPRAFAGLDFLDRDPIPPFSIPDPIRDQLVMTLREALDEQPPAIIPHPLPHNAVDQDTAFFPPRPLRSPR